MKNSILSGWRNLFGRGQAEPETDKEPTHEERFRQIYQEELRRVKQNPEFVASIFAEDRIDRENRQREHEFYEKNVTDEEVDAAIKRHDRAGELIKMGNSYRPLTTERCHEEPDLGRD